MHENLTLRAKTPEGYEAEWSDLFSFLLSSPLHSSSLFILFFIIVLGVRYGIYKRSYNISNISCTVSCSPDKTWIYPWFHFIVLILFLLLYWGLN
jgi:hypothetical protein